MLIKVCGVTDPATAKSVVALGADFVGIVLYRKSKNHVEVDEAAVVAAAIRESGAIPVAVFVDGMSARINKVCEKIGVDTVQLHGRIPRREHRELPNDYTRLYTISVDANDNIVEADLIGLDALDNERDFLVYHKLLGTGGRSVPWGEFVNPYADFRFFMSGSLEPCNIAEVLAVNSPYGVNVGGGLNGSNWEKDLQLAREFVGRVKATSSGVVEAAV